MKKNIFRSLGVMLMLSFTLALAVASKPVPGDQAKVRQGANNQVKQTTAANTTWNTNYFPAYYAFAGISYPADFVMHELNEGGPIMDIESVANMAAGIPGKDECAVDGCVISSTGLEITVSPLEKADMVKEQIATKYSSLHSVKANKDYSPYLQQTYYYERYGKSLVINVETVKMTDAHQHTVDTFLEKLNNMPDWNLGVVKKVYKKNGTFWADVDMVEYYSGATAEKEAKRAGAQCFLPKAPNAPCEANGVHYFGINTIKTVVAVALDPKVTIVNPNDGLGIPGVKSPSNASKLSKNTPGYTIASVADLMGAPKNFLPRPMFVGVANGKITQLVVWPQS